jgi:hypothetical protein
MTNKIDSRLTGTLKNAFFVNGVVLSFEGDTLKIMSYNPETGVVGDYDFVSAKNFVFDGSPDIQEGAILTAKGVFSNRAQVGYANSIYDLLPSYFITSVIGGRLHIGNGSLDQGESNILKYSAYLHDQIALYYSDVNRWQLLHIGTPTLNTSGLLANRNYDIFGYDNGGTFTLEASLWASDTLRTLTPLGVVDGVEVKGNNPTRRYLGTIRTDDDSKVRDTPACRRIWNRYNRVRRSLLSTSPTNSWILPHTATSWRAWDAFNDEVLTNVAVDFVVGAPNVDAVELTASCNMAGGYHSGAVIGIAENTPNHTDCDIYPSHYNEGGYTHLSAYYSRLPSTQGYYKLYAVERYQGEIYQTTTMYGTDGTTRVAGLIGTTWQ